MNLAEMLAMADQATQGMDLDKKTEFTLLDPGTYQVAITGAEGPIESKRTDPSNPNVHGQYLKLELTVTGPNFVGRKLWMNNNIICVPRDSSAEAVKKSQMAIAIGMKERKVMLDSLGLTGINAASELVGATFSADVVIKKADGERTLKDKNEITSIKPIGSSAIRSASTAAASSATTPAQPSNRPKMPWEK